MKNNIIIALGCFLLLGTTSCVDLDQEPNSWITEEEYIEVSQSVESVQKAASGLYKNLWGGNYDFSCRMLRLGMSADQMAANPVKVQQYLIDLRPSIGLNKGEDWSSPWGNFWNIITASNKILGGTPIPDDEAEAKKVNAALGEVHFMRALAYFHLVRLFGDLPLATKRIETVNDIEEISNLDRSSVADIYNKVIVPDLIAAIASLPEISRSKSSDTPSKWVAQTLLADVYLTMAGWPLNLGREYYAKAAAEAKGVIDNSRLSLELTYAGLWKEATKTTVKEHLFAVHNSVKEGRASQYGTSFYPFQYWNVAESDGGGWADYYGAPDYLASYPEGARKDVNYMLEWDVRNPSTKIVRRVTWQQSEHGFPCIAKYQDYNNGKPGKSAQSNGLTPVYRYADVLLFYAEASVQATGSVDALALKCLQDIQNRAGVSPVTATTDPTTFDKAVFNEYGWEFFAEGAKRWFQVVRRDKVAEVKARQWDNSFFKANNHYYFPIPAAQMKLTSWTNNAGY